MWPLSLRQGIMTVTLGVAAARAGAGAGRAMRPYISESWATPGRCPSQRFTKSDSRGTWAGTMICASVRTVSKSASASMFRTSSGGSHASGGCRYFRPVTSARRSSGCHRRL
ncbi:MAG: hypothetical protein DMF78_25935 [Acidobacteria bacterium]|nr:MAG: hypothetical protein DMF78_25935 [Acidobacteriota bacterium]